MSDGIKADTVQGKIIIGVVVALLAGSSSPWWVDRIFPGNGDSNSQRDTPVENPEPSPSGGDGENTFGEVDRSNNDINDGTTGEDQSTCRVILTPPFGSLKREPRTVSGGFARVESGEYLAVKYREVEFAGESQGWYLIKTEEGKGWIRDNTLTISDKTEGCPP